VAERDAPLGSGVAAWDDSQPAGQAIFRDFEVHELGNPPGPKFRGSAAGLDPASPARQAAHVPTGVARR
jgi:hypothetical protein